MIDHKQTNKPFDEYFEKQMEDPDFRESYEEDLLQFNLAVEIAKLRQELGLSQTEVAARIKTSPSVISRLENGENVELRTLMKVLKTLNATIKVESLT